MKWDTAESKFLLKLSATREERTVKNYIKHLRIFKEWWRQTHGELPEPEKLTEEDLYAFLVYIKKYEPSYRRKIYGDLVRFLEFCRNPNVYYMKQNMPKDVEKPREYYTEKELKKILEMFPEDNIINFQNKVYVYILAYTGMRAFEVNSLTWDMIDFDRETIKVKQKGGSTKTVYIPKALKAVLKRYYEFTKHFMELRQQLRLNTTNALFFKIDRYTMEIQPIGERTMYGRLKYNVPVPGFNLKKFRSTLAKLMIDRGAHLEEVARQLGHKDLKTTKKYYADLSIGRVKNAFEQLGLDDDLVEDANDEPDRGDSE